MLFVQKKFAKHAPISAETNKTRVPATYRSLSLRFCTGRAAEGPELAIGESAKGEMQDVETLNAEAWLGISAVKSATSARANPSRR